MLEIYRKTVDLIDSGCEFATAVVLDTDGSTPQETGVRAVIEADGKIWGTVGGGVAEAEAQKAAIEACKTKRPKIIALELKHAYSRDALAICGGRMRILIDPTAAKDRQAFAAAAEARKKRTKAVLITDIYETDVVRTNVVGRISGSDTPNTEAIDSCLAKEKATIITPESPAPDAPTAVLIEPVIPNPVLVIAGAGHISRALADLAVRLGFDVTVIDDRAEFADPAMFPEEVNIKCGDIAKEVAAFPLGDDTSIVIVTRGHKQDAEVLEACIRKPAAYIGMIGSKRKIAMIRKNFIDSGIVTKDEFDKVFAPIGFDIGAITVPEIALSIAAELVAVRRKGSAQRPRSAAQVE